MAKEYKNFINGKWIACLSGKTFDNVNPANTDDVIGSFQDSDERDIQQAVVAAQAAFDKWNQIAITSREVYLYKAADILSRRADEVAQALTREMGKTLPEAKGEVGRGVQILRYYAGEARRICGETYPSDNAATMLYTLREPLGVVGLITPWNFPVAIPLWKLAPAIIYGNTALIRVSQDAPLTGILLGEVFEEAGLPPGVLNIVTGYGRLTNKALVDDNGIAAISFTGSTAVGRQIYQRCGELGKKVQLEMGGQNPVVVMADADLEQAVEISLAGAFFSTGQKCTATRRVIVQRQVMTEFTDKFAAKTRALKIGAGAESGTQIGPIINQRQMERVLEGIEQGIKEGARLVYGGQRLSGNGYDKGFFLQPAIFTGVTPRMSLAQEEIFGPVVGLIAFDKLEEALQIANSVNYGLSASIVTKSISAAHYFVKKIKAGIVHVNSQTAGAECHVPFGGMKDSSSGTREQGKAALEFYTQLKTVYFDLPR
jgi:acyl-CoA reductase-like NAD-dependent aldehyde dehydrogenase